MPRPDTAPELEDDVSGNRVERDCGLVGDGNTYAANKAPILPVANPEHICAMPKSKIPITAPVLAPRSRLRRTLTNPTATHDEEAKDPTKTIVEGWTSFIEVSRRCACKIPQHPVKPVKEKVMREQEATMIQP